MERKNRVSLDGGTTTREVESLSLAEVKRALRFGRFDIEIREAVHGMTETPRVWLDLYAGFYKETYGTWPVL